MRGSPQASDHVGDPVVRLRPAGFDAFYRDAHPAMRRLAYLITRSAPVADEVVADGFVTVLERWASLDSPGAYLRTVVVRAAVKTRQRRWRERSVPAEQLHSAWRDTEPDVDAMWDRLGTLPSRQRAVLVLRFYADCSNAEIAAMLRCPEATVRTLSHRGLAALRKEMEQWTK